ncbi:MAG: LysR family transcriptional regulator, partial [Christensenellales bacterium]
MKISQLRYFMTVCRYNNITKAAEELYVSQPAISSSIKDLETEFGVKLFYRQNNKLLLTDEGEYFLDKVTDILGAVDILS